MRINQNSKTARALAVLQKAEVPLSERDVAAAIHDLRFSRYDAEYQIGRAHV